MRAQTLPAAAGWRWLAAGFAIFRRNPPLLALLVVCYWVTVLFLNALPVIGALAASLAMPGLAVGLMQAARDLERGATIGLPTLFSGFRRNPRTLLALGALYLACTIAILSLSALVDGGELLSFMLSSKAADREMIESGDLALPALFVMLLMTPVVMAYWFAPVLAAWHGLSAGKSLFFSIVACLRNWRAFVVYFVSIAIFGMLLPGLIVAAVTILLPGGGEVMSVALSSLLVVVLMPTLYGSFYASYRDVFVVVNENA